MTKSHRIEWVDIAKGIAIILMVMGHEVKNQWIYTVIFSFHMPLFFILSGYTSSSVKSFSKLKVKLSNSFKRIWLLASLMVVLLGLEYKTIYSTFNFKQQVLLGIYWGSNIYSIGAICAGVMWFLFVFFWAKLVFDLFQIIMRQWCSGLFLLFSSIISMYLCNGFQHWLPQTFDIVPIAALFMWCGHFIRHHLESLSMLQKKIALILSLVIWITCL